MIATFDGQSITSTVVQLTVLGPPNISDPMITTNGNTITLSIAATDTVPYYAQWLLNGNAIAGTKTTYPSNSTETISYSITNSPLNSGDYQVVVANIVAAAESPPFNVAANYGPLVVTNINLASSLAFNPLTNGVSGMNSSFSTAPADGPALIAGKPASAFLWYNWKATFSGVISLTTRGSSFDTLMGVYTGNSESSLTPVAQDDDSGGFFTSLVTFNCTSNVTYQIVVAGYQGKVGTVQLGLSPGPPAFPGPPGGHITGGSEPVITEQPTNQIAPAGAVVTLSVTATGATSYQWFFEANPVSGATGSTFVLAGLTSNNVGNYYVEVSNSVGSVQSAVVSIEIAAQRNLGLSFTPGTLLVDKFGDAVDLTSANTTARYRRPMEAATPAASRCRNRSAP